MYQIVVFIGRLSERGAYSDRVIEKIFPKKNPHIRKKNFQ